MGSGFGDLELRGVLDVLPFGLHVWELDDSRRLRLGYANATAGELLHGRVHEAGASYDDIFPGDGEAVRVAVEIAAVLESGVSRENILVDREGEQPLRLTIRPIAPGRVVVAFRPRGAVSSRATPEQYFDALFYSAEDAILTKDPSGVITSWNPAAESLYGYSAGEVIGTPVDILLPPERSNEVAEILARLRRGERVASFETTRVRRDGTAVDVSLTISPIRDINGDFVGAATIARDLTAQRLLEQRLRQTERLEAIGRLAGAIAHDFNNLLTVFRASAELLAANPGDDAFVERTTKDILGSAELGAALTAQLLAFARNQVIRPRVLDLGELVRSTMSTFGRLLGERIDLVVQITEDGLLVNADESQLQRVVLNLCVNARDAMPDGGTLTVSARHIVLDAAAASLHPGVEPERYVALEITDTGIGMDAETARHVFEPFFTTKSDGTGLGLATTYGVVRQSGGHVMLYSEPGLGTTFRVLLPPAKAPAGPALVRLSGPPALGRLSILYVEDTDAVRDLVSRLLDSAGHEVVAVEKPLDALERFDVDPQRFDLLITDMVMPGMTGAELAARLRERRPAFNVVFTSGYPTEVSLGDAVADRHSEFVQKPFGLDDLLRAVALLPG